MEQGCGANWFRQLAIQAFAVLAISAALLSSLMTGAGDMTWAGLLQGPGSESWALLWNSRLPRTLALLLMGVSLAVAGLLMQMLVQNRYVEPATAGTNESAMAGVLFIMLVMPDAAIPLKILTSIIFAFCGTVIFLGIVRRVRLGTQFAAPLIGIVLGGIIHSGTTFFAYRYDMIQSLQAWTTGDFSGVTQGRYEVLWIGFILAIVTYIFSDRFTMIGMGKHVSTSLGVSHDALLLYGLLLVSAIATVSIVTAGAVPFVGIIVPNLVRHVFGDRIRRSLPWVALLGGLLTLGCDIAGRLVISPYEIPIGVMMGCVGSIAFLCLILNPKKEIA